MTGFGNWVIHARFKTPPRVGVVNATEKSTRMDTIKRISLMLCGNFSTGWFKLFVKRFNFSDETVPHVKPFPFPELHVFGLKGFYNLSPR